MVDLPLAAAERFRVLPAGAKTFAVGMAKSCVDPFYQPYKGARDGDALGFAGALVKGTFGVLAKIGPASIGLVAYPGQGIKRSIKVAFVESSKGDSEFSTRRRPRHGLAMEGKRFTGRGGC